MKSSWWVLDRRTTIGYAIVILAVAAAGSAGFFLLREARQSGDLARRNQELQHEIARIEIHLLNAETGQRGYLLTGDPAYLEPYDQGTAVVKDALRQLGQRTADSATQQSRVRQLEALVATKLAELQHTIEQRRAGGLEAALPIVTTNAGKRAMDQIRMLLAAASQEEGEYLNTSLEFRSQRFSWAGRVIVGSSVLALIVLALSTSAVNHNTRRRQQAEWQARESEERLRVTLRSIGDAVIATDTAGCIVFMNPVAEALTGWTQALGRGRPLDDVFRIVNEETRAVVENPVTKVLREGVVVGLANHTVLLARTGEEIPVDDSGAPIRDAGGEIMGVVLVFRDVRDRQHAEHEHRRLVHEESARRAAENANRAKDEFLAVLSHELRSPLQGILGWLGVLRDSRSNAAQQQRAMQAMERGVRQQAQLVNDLLDASRIIAGKLQLERGAIELAVVVRNCVDQLLPLAREKQVEVSTDVDDCGTVVADPHRLHQAVTNILANALKFTPAGGRVDVRCHRENDDVVITVRDSGEGIAPEFLPFLFDRFSQAAESRVQPVSGLGLGLSIARQIVELHGGTIRAESDGPGRGATFVIRVPLATEPDGARCEPKPRPAESSLVGVSMLVVDDDSETRESLALLLTQRGASVRNAGSAAEALELYAQHTPQVVLSDVSMPEHDGYQLVAALRRNAADGGPIAVALTGFATEEDRRRASSAGFNAHVAKPVDIDALVTVLRGLLDAKS